MSWDLDACDDGRPEPVDSDSILREHYKWRQEHITPEELSKKIQELLDLNRELLWVVENTIKYSYCLPLIVTEKAKEVLVKADAMK